MSEFIVTRPHRKNCGGKWQGYWLDSNTNEIFRRKLECSQENCHALASLEFTITEAIEAFGGKKEVKS